MPFEANVPRFKRTEIHLNKSNTGNPIPCYELMASGDAKIILVPTDDSWQFFHLYWFKHESFGMRMLLLASLISREDLGENVFE